MYVKFKHKKHNYFLTFLHLSLYLVISDKFFRKKLYFYFVAFKKLKISTFLILAKKIEFWLKFWSKTELFN